MAKRAKVSHGVEVERLPKQSCIESLSIQSIISAGKIRRNGDTKSSNTSGIWPVVEKQNDW